MESLKYLHEYFLRFHSVKFNDFLDIFKSLYKNDEDLDKKLEFSLLINSVNSLDLRFGLFKLYDSKKINSLFEKQGYDAQEIKLLDDFAPEYGLGFDWGKNDPRLKIYFLRLPDNPEFKDRLASKISQVSKAVNVRSEHMQRINKENCYLIGVDYGSAGKRAVKIYTRNIDANFSEVLEQLKKEGINSENIAQLMTVFSEKDFKDVTYSYKYSNRTKGLSGFSVFFEVEQGIDEKIAVLIKKCFPDRFNEFKNIINSLEKFKYSHAGITFAHGEESICLYYSPDAA